ncbi:hypothetical protein YC2023_119549 [Brassica napus]|uniref:(rape) hypothetical protein n=1 Tax=Brassica napus TaxID=3708 RepID=A0A816J0A0_BRANA|nr:unnamed protein product [Brassica napus]
MASAIVPSLRLSPSLSDATSPSSPSSSGDDLGAIQETTGSWSTETLISPLLFTLDHHPEGYHGLIKQEVFSITSKSTVQKLFTLLELYCRESIGRYIRGAPLVDKADANLDSDESISALTIALVSSGPSLRARFVGQGYKHVCGRADMWYLRFQLILKVHLILASTVDKKKVKKWKEALTILAAISGEDSRNWRDESKLIKKIVKDISDKLVFTSLDDSKGLIGMSSHMDFLQSMMSIEDEDVRMVGIWGMGGVGKTTIAKYLYSGLSCRFQAHCFIENVKEVYNRYGVRHFTRRVSMQNVWRAFEGLSNLKLLNFYDLAYNGETRMHLPDGLSYLPRKLRSLHWDGYPLKSMPSRFHPEFLVEFCMSNSHLQKLWNGVQSFPPEICQTMRCLRWLDLEGTGIKELPENNGNLIALKVLQARRTAIRRAPRSIALLTRLQVLAIGDSFYVSEGLHSLCPRLSSFDDLRVLCLSNMNMTEIPNSIGDLWSLSELDLSASNCYKLDQEAQSLIHRNVQLDSARPEHLYFPGRDVPSCFSHQTMGPSLRIHVPQSQSSSDILGFSTCIMIGGNGQCSMNDVKIRCSCILKGVDAK